MDKKAILWPVIVSILIHVTLLAVAGMIDLTGKITPMDVLSVSIKEPDLGEKNFPKKEIKTKKKAKAPQAPKKKETAINDDEWREDTIDLGSTDIKYSTYLTEIKKRILSIWKYPQKAFEKNEEGDVVVKMSIDADGSLAGATLLSSSGSVDLDDGALDVVLQAAPYEPLPEIYNLSRLNIIASFNYKIMD
ncbi:MAG: energy transducer TonB [Syntrophaceae bacterium]|nr:energy transducer TonB [Syntrophaceae bacterium]